MARVTASPSATASELGWMSALSAGNLVELLVYGQRMSGRVLRVNPDNFTIRIPIAEQTGDVRRFSPTGTAVVSLADGAANVPVTVSATGEFVRVQVIGPAKIVQRRRYVRVPLTVPIKIAWREAPSGSWRCAESTTQDISVGGLRVAPARTVWPSAGEEVVIMVDLPDGSTVKERALVVGKTPEYGLRLEFIPPAAPTRVWIDTLLDPEVF